MKKLTIILSAFLVLSAFAVSTEWKSDKAHSQLGFTIEHMGIADISGTFNDFDASIKSTKSDFSDAVIEMTAKVSSIDTRVEARDNHLRSADFFDAEKYPEIKFKSTSLTPNGTNKYKLTGNLTMHGITEEVTLDLVYNGQVENPMNKKPIAGFKVTGTLQRSDFKIGEGFPAPMLSDEVRIQADGEFATE